MFSGIVEATGRVIGLDSRASPSGPQRLRIELGAWAASEKQGASIAINGVCLTLCDVAGSVGGFDVIPETLRRTNLGRLAAGDRVNLERSLRADSRIDGHIVQGHVDAVARVVEIDRGCGEHRLYFSPPDELLQYLVSKGSIALDGVSLTLVEIAPGRCSVALIPTTVEWTTLGERGVGDWLNVEIDMMARLVVNRLNQIIADRGLEPTSDLYRAGGQQ